MLVIIQAGCHTVSLHSNSSLTVSEQWRAVYLVEQRCAILKGRSDRSISKEEEAAPKSRSVSGTLNKYSPFFSTVFRVVRQSLRVEDSLPCLQ
jgi:hypothetical protein